MNLLRIENDYSYLMTEDSSLREKLWSSLRFKTRDYFHSPLYRQKLWDGYIDFLSKKTGRFLTGLLPEVRFALEYLKEEYKEADNRQITPFLFEKVDSQFLNQWLQPGQKPITLDAGQIDLINQALTYKRGIVKAPTGCHRKGQGILMFNGTVKKVEKVKVGDILVGMDSTPRTVLSLHRGTDEMFEVRPIKGQSFVVNGDHILTLVRTPNNHHRYPSEVGGKLIDVTVREWQVWSKWKKHIHKLFRVGVNFKHIHNLPIEPYFLGLLLGDGMIKHTPNVTTMDKPIVMEVFRQARIWKLKVRKRHSPNQGRSSSYYLVGRQGVYNPIATELKKLELWGRKSHNKIIPFIYKTASTVDRLNLLAGIIDTDGSLSNNCYDITLKSKQLINDIVFVARSLGLACTISKRRIKSPFANDALAKIYHRCHISGNVDVIPCRLKHKQVSSRLQKKNASRTGFTIHKIADKELYYGFSLNGDGRYLLDDFTVTHNSGKTYILLALIKSLPPGTPILFLANRKMVLDRNYDEMKEWGVENLGYLDGNIHEPNLITFALVQSIHRIAPVLPKFRALFVDEVHMMMGDQCIDTYKKLKGCGVRICMSATPFKYQLKKRNSKETIEGDKVHKYSVKGYFGAEFKTESTATGDLRVEHLQTQGRLSPSKCTYHYIDHPQIPYDIYIDAVTNGIAQNWEFHQIVARLSQSLTGRTLILVERLSHGDALNKLIPGSLWVQGKDNKKTRTNVVKQLQEAKGNVIAIATVGIFNAAVNVFVHNLINAAGGKAEHEIIQRIGRGLRTAEDKDILNYHDFIFRINQYLERHSHKRIRILQEEGHEVIIKDTIDF